MTSLIKSLLTATCLCTLPLAAQAVPYCDALQSTDTLPSKYKKKGPFMSDTASGWIVGADQMRADYAVTPEMEALWARIGTAFAAKGADLIVLSPPPRPLFAPADLQQTAASDIAQMAQGYGRYIAGLQAAGLTAPDLSNLAATEQPHAIYFARDTHWTPFGAMIAAQELAAAAGLLGTAGSASIEGSYSEKGSLSTVIDAACGQRPAAETVPAVSYPAAPAADLLAETPAPTLALVGSSFSNRYQRDAYQVADALSHAFGAGTQNVSISGGGMAGSMIAFLESGALDSGAFTRVVWEVPYTTPLTDIGGLRQVLSLLGTGTSARPETLHDGEIGDSWTSIKHGFDSAGTARLEILTPQVDAGQLLVELFGADGSKRKLTLRKSDRIAGDARTARWTLALSDLPEGTVTRFKLRLKGAKSVTPAHVSLLR